MVYDRKRNLSTKDSVEIDKLLENFVLFIDTCSLMHEGSSKVFNRIFFNILKIKKKKIILPTKVIEEINKHADSKDVDIRKKATNAIRIIKNYQKHNLISIQGEESDSFADNLFLAIFTKFRMKYDLCLITQDLGLSEDILKLNRKSSSVDRGIKKIIVARISDREHKLKICKCNPKSYNRRSEQTYSQKKIVKFKTFEKPIKPNESSLKCSKIPITNDVVQSNNFKEMKLVQEISKGGEGIVYLTNNDLICKIYKKNKLRQNKYEKLKLMVSKPIRNEGICWPKDLVYNEHNEFVGYLMDKASGYELQKSIFLPMLLRKRFPNWNRYNLVKLSKTILSQISFLHSRNVIIGDINPFNILVKSENKVYFIDTDSFQIENYPCPVGTINFTAPEIQGKNYKTFLRTFEHENFAVATLLFMILLPGKPPYSQQGGGNPVSNIKKQDFSYPLGENTNKKTPPGQWRYIWSNLPYYLKKSFFNNFKYAKRINSSDWLEIVKRYLYDLEKRYLSDEVFPTGFKIVSEYAKNHYGIKDTI